MDGPTDRPTDRRTDGRSDGQTDGRTHSLIESWFTTKNKTKLCTTTLQESVLLSVRPSVCITLSVLLSVCMFLTTLSAGKRLQKTYTVFPAFFSMFSGDIIIVLLCIIIAFAFFTAAYNWRRKRRLDQAHQNNATSGI